MIARLLCAAAVFLPGMPAAASVPMVLFDRDSADSTPHAASILDSVARDARNGGHVVIRVTGAADRWGCPA